jgi:predicted deacylase
VERLTAELIRKLALLACATVVASLGVYEFRELRTYKETVVVSDAFTGTVMLSKYFRGIRGTAADTPVYVFDSNVRGGSMLLLGGTHPYEPAGTLMTYVVMENIKVAKGRVFVIPHSNLSASTQGMLGNAYPKFYRIRTQWGEQKYRIGDRGTNPLDQWPDPFTYVHYPSGQNLAYEDLRNLNRAFPGRPDGSLTEQLAYAIMELIRKEKIDLSVDVHEASLAYPVVATYVSHERANDICMMASMVLSAGEFPMKTETSPKNLRGLTHRELGDYSDTLAVLMETPEPFIERFAGRMTEDLMVTGKDEFEQTAARRGLLFTSYDISKGCTIDYRVGRHLSGTLEVIRQMNSFFPEKELIVSFPRYADVMEHGVGAFLHNPAKARPSRVFYN